MHLVGKSDGLQRLFFTYGIQHQITRFACDVFDQINDELWKQILLPPAPKRFQN